MTPTAEVLTMTKKGLARFVVALKKIQAGRKQTGRGPLVATRAFGGRNVPLHQPGVEGIVTCIGSLNREVNRGRVGEYRISIMTGEWWFTPDPIVVTDEGYIINGQHRLLAVEELQKDDDWSDKTAPQFVVVWGVDKRAAILMDEARRTASDRRDIAIRFARSA